MSDNSLTSFTKDLILSPIKEWRVSICAGDDDNPPDAAFYCIRSRDDHNALLMLLDTNPNITMESIGEGFLFNEGEESENPFTLDSIELADSNGVTARNVYIGIAPPGSIEGIWDWDPFYGKLEGAIYLYPDGYKSPL